MGHFTLDNASNNTIMLEELKDLLHTWDISFNSVDRRIMCFAHMINICCQHVIGQFTNIKLLESVNEFVTEKLPILPDWQSFNDAVKRDPVTLGHNIVRVLQSSGHRCDAFD